MVNLFGLLEGVIDLRGAKLDEKVFENGALSVLTHNGEANLFMAPPQVLSSFKNGLIDQKKIYVGNNNEGVQPTWFTSSRFV